MSWWSSSSPSLIRYDINRLRVFDHLKREYLSGLTVTPVPGTSALRIAANGGSLPQQIDLWLDVASYDANNAGVKLAAKKNATVKVGDAVVGFVDIRDGQWNIDHGQFTTVNHDRPQTTLQLKATGPWTAGRYQIAAISKANEKYISDFFVDLSSGTGQYLFFPFGMDNIDHFELRPLAEQVPFFFDALRCRQLRGCRAMPASRILRPVVIDAGQESRVRLPSGAVVQLLGIAYDGPAPYLLVGSQWAAGECRNEKNRRIGGLECGSANADFCVAARAGEISRVAGVVFARLLVGRRWQRSRLSGGRVAGRQVAHHGCASGCR